MRCSALIAPVLVLAAASPALARTRHLTMPPPAGPPLGRTLTVDEDEWTLRASKRTVASGTVRIRVYNRGEDDHNLVVVDRAGRAYGADLKPGESALVVPRLAPGTYRLFCSLAAGTPESHEQRGMRTVLEVR